MIVVNKSWVVRNVPHLEFGFAVPDDGTEWFAHTLFAALRQAPVVPSVAMALSR